MYIFTSTTLKTLQYHCRYNNKKGDQITTVKKYKGIPQIVVHVTYLKTLNH